MDELMEEENSTPPKERQRILKQVGLFLFTCITTTFAGAELCFGKTIYIGHETYGVAFNPAYTWDDFFSGLQFSIPFLLILTVHEFGHYFTAMYHKIKASLPYYIPFPPIPFIPSLLGTMGAIIRIRSKVHSNIQHFDIGLAGPLAGFILSLVVIGYGFATLPPPEYVFQFHPDYEKFGVNYAEHVYTDEYIKSQGGALELLIGSNLLFEFFGLFVDDPARIPNPHEMMHYPILMAGFAALFFTSLNLLPIGQLDGGHIVYGLFGRKGHSIIATVSFVALVFYSGLGAANIHSDQDQVYWYVLMTVMFNYFCLKGLQLSAKDTLMYALVMFAVQFIITAIFPTVDGYRPWVLFAFLIGSFIGVHHPPSEIEQPLDLKRVILGWISLLIFVLCFSPKPFVMKLIMPD